MTDSTHSELLLNESSATNELLPKIAELAKELTPISEMAALLDINEELLRMAINDKSSEIRRVYMRAKAETAREFRKHEIELAKVGSPIAVQLTSHFLKEMDADEII